MRFLELTALDTPDSQINNNSNFNYSTEINVSLAGSNHNTCKDAEGVVDAEAGAEKIIARKTIIMYAIERSAWLRERQDYALFFLAPENR